MGRPSNASYAKFWEETKAHFGRQGWTCVDCGRQDQMAYVQPQHPAHQVTHADPLSLDALAGRPAALCADCIDRRNRARTATRKAAVDALPRCEVPGCKGPRKWRIGRCLWVCGRHKTKAEHGHARAAAHFGGMALFLPMDYDRTDLLRWASGA